MAQVFVTSHTVYWAFVIMQVLHIRTVLLHGALITRILCKICIWNQHDANVVCTIELISHLGSLVNLLPWEHNYHIARPALVGTMAI